MGWHIELNERNERNEEDECLYWIRSGLNICLGATHSTYLNKRRIRIPAVRQRRIAAGISVASFKRIMCSSSEGYRREKRHQPKHTKTGEPKSEKERSLIGASLSRRLRHLLLTHL